MQIRYIFSVTIFLGIIGCNNSPKQETKKEVNENETNASCVCSAPNRLNAIFENKITAEVTNIDSLKESNPQLKNMVFIPGGIFNMGARDSEFARADEYPVHPVRVDDFFMDSHPVTNGQFKEFVEITGYVTTAEKDIDWKKIKNNYRRVQPSRLTVCWKLHHWYSHQLLIVSI